MNKKELLSLTAAGCAAALAAGTVTSVELTQTYLDAKRKTLRDATLGTYRRQLNALLPELRQPITRADLEALLADKTPHARNTAVRSLSAFFAWCVATGALDRNPADGLRLARVAEPTRTILTLDQTRTLLAHAQAHAGGNGQQVFGPVIILKRSVQGIFILEKIHIFRAGQLRPVFIVIMYGV